MYSRIESIRARVDAEKGLVSFDFQVTCETDRAFLLSLVERAVPLVEQWHTFDLSHHTHRNGEKAAQWLRDAGEG
jgi:hypothetical protein